MKRYPVSAGTVAAAFAALAFSSVPAHAAYRCDNPVGFADQRACAAAAAGPDALRVFVWRTRMIYGLYYFDYVAPGV